MSGDACTGPYYVILDVVVRDVAQYKIYIEQVAPALEAAGGRYVVRGGPLTTYEGDWRPTRVVLLEFPSRQAWESFYYSSDYQRLKSIRDAASDGRMIGVEGLVAAVDLP